MNQNSEIPQQQASFCVGEHVKVIRGPFQDFTVCVDSVDEAKERVKVLVPWNPGQFTDKEFVPLYEHPQELLVELDFRQIDRCL